jgi:tetratricopeptide (TPR) repeat protein
MLARIAATLALGAVFSTANAEPTIVGSLPAEADCKRCHADIWAQWSASAHRRSSFDNPYYRVSAEAFRRERGRAASRFCAGCHEPVLLPVLERDVDPASPEAQAGVGCLVCHSIDAVDLSGNGGYHARVRTEVHGARAAILVEARLCAACHKVGLRPDVTGDRWLRGQDDWDAWLASSSSGNGAGAVFRAPSPTRCQDCHMPLEPAAHDAAAKKGMVRSHRFLGANAALAHLRGDRDTEARIAAFLAGSVALDLFVDGAQAVAVLANRRVGHRFPGGTNDSNEAWLEVTARDAAGRVLGRSGVLDRDGALDGDAHLVRAQPVDGDGEPLRLRDPQHMRGVAFDTSVGPADPQAVRFALPDGTARVEARLLYRKFGEGYARRACGRDVACREVPVLEIARAGAAVSQASANVRVGGTGSGPAPILDGVGWRVLVERGLALAGALADRAEQALPFLEAARDAEPDRPEPLLALARAMLRLGRTDDALAFARDATRRAPSHPAAPWLEALALARAYRHAAARAPVEKLLTLVPDDRAALLLAARVFGVTGDPARALAAADHAAALDPDLDEAHYQRSLALAELGRTVEARAAEAAWLAHRSADEIDLALRDKLRARHPDRPDESEPVHLHRLH